jgi:hypothetical protein
MPPAPSYLTCRVILVLTHSILKYLLEVVQVTKPKTNKTRIRSLLLKSTGSGLLRLPYDLINSISKKVSLFPWLKGMLSSEKKIKQKLGPLERGNLSFHAKF